VGKTALKGPQYERVEDAPVHHRQALLYFIADMTPKQVAQVTRMSVEMAELVLEHPCNREYILAQKAAVDAERVELTRRYRREVKVPTLDLHARLLQEAHKTDEKTGDWKPGVSEATMRKLLDVGYSHDPDGQFAPRTKQETTHTVNVLGSAELQRLRDERLRPSIAKCVDVEFCVVDDSEFGTLRQTGPDRTPVRSLDHMGEAADDPV